MGCCQSKAAGEGPHSRAAEWSGNQARGWGISAWDTNGAGAICGNGLGEVATESGPTPRLLSSALEPTA